MKNNENNKLKNKNKNKNIGWIAQNTDLFPFLSNIFKRTADPAPPNYNNQKITKEDEALINFFHFLF